jgi:hypothetical protein
MIAPKPRFRLLRVSVPGVTAIPAGSRATRSAPGLSGLVGTCSLKRLFDMTENAVIDTALCVGLAARSFDIGG